MIECLLSSESSRYPWAADLLENKVLVVLPVSTGCDG